MTINFYTRLELKFWDWAIPTLTNSRRIHWLFRQIHPLTDPVAVRKLGLRSLIVSLAGFASGAAAFGLFFR
jgi:Fe-S-cluster formation regulator IscX/YfhJ